MLYLAIILGVAVVGCTSIEKTPISENEAIAIAKRVISEREHWPEKQLLEPNISQAVSYDKPQQNQEGNWAVSVHQEKMEEDSGNMAFVPGAGRTILISKFGKVLRYNQSGY